MILRGRFGELARVKLPEPLVMSNGGLAAVDDAPSTRQSPSSSRARHLPAVVEMQYSRSSPTKGKRTPLGRGSPRSNIIKSPQVSSPRVLGHSQTSPKLNPRAIASPSLSSSAVKQRGKETPAKRRRVDDGRFDEPSPFNNVSSDSFRKNETMRKQREARNYLYEGDVNAPKLTRSGKVVGAEDNADEYGAELEEEETPSGNSQDDEQLRFEPIDVKDEKKLHHAKPLPSGAKPYVLKILETLESREIASNPPAFEDEKKNESLAGLVSLLKGTVDRGEGNSALVVGPRGSGKTRVRAYVLAILTPKTMSRALNLLPSASTSSPIVVRLSGHAQVNDRLAIREIGRQIAEAEGRDVTDGDGGEKLDNEDEVREGPQFRTLTVCSKSTLRPHCRATCLVS